MIEQYAEPFDVALALHACGNATDYALLSAVDRRAAFVACPCCVGKLKFSTAGGSSFSSTRTTWQGMGSGPQLARAERLAGALGHPRSEWLRLALGPAATEEDFKALAQVRHLVTSRVFRGTIVPQQKNLVRTRGIIGR
jgi:hypothetical protein